MGRSDRSAGMKPANLLVGILVLSTSGCALAPLPRAWNADTLSEAKRAHPAERVGAGDLALLSANDLAKAPILRTAYNDVKPPIKVVAQIPADAEAPAMSMSGDDDDDDEMSPTTGAREVNSPIATSPRSRGKGKGSSSRSKAGSGTLEDRDGKGENLGT